jgi:hypothetical protein
MSGGEHSWKRVLFDTNMVSRWMDGEAERIKRRMPF